MLLELKDVSVYYAKVAGIRDISIEVEERDIVTHIGANRAVKPLP